jgi:hypothetical protein
LHAVKNPDKGIRVRMGERIMLVELVGGVIEKCLFKVIL